MESPPELKAPPPAGLGGEAGCRVVGTALFRSVKQTGNGAFTYPSILFKK